MSTVTVVLSPGFHEDLGRPLPDPAAHNRDLEQYVAALHKLLGRRVVFDHHDLSAEMYEARFGADASRAVTRVLLLLERWCCRAADHVIATNDSYASLDVERHGVGSRRGIGRAHLELRIEGLQRGPWICRRRQSRLLSHGGYRRKHEQQKK